MKMREYCKSGYPFRKTAEQHPDQVTIKKHPGQNDGCIYATMPADWLKLSPPIKREMTDEQRQAASERMKEFAQKRKNSANIPEQDE